METKINLVEEAKARGLIPGVYIKSPWMTGVSLYPITNNYQAQSSSHLSCVGKGGIYTLYSKGQWATPVWPTTIPPKPKKI